MARAKIKCKGKNQSGTDCNNWAISGSLYCHLHQSQVTEKDIHNQKETESISTIIIVIFIIIGFGISSCLGCDGEFINWLGNLGDIISNS